MRYLSALLLLLLGLTASAPAHASYIYTFHRTSTNGPADIVLTVDDAAVPGDIAVSESGSCVFIPIPSQCGSYTGPATFISFVGHFELFTPLRALGSLHLSAGFAADGSLAAISFDLRGVSTDLMFSGTSGTYGGDNSGFVDGNSFRFCTGSNPCPFTGFFTASLPEPSMLPLMGGVLLAFGTWRRWAM